MLPLKCGAGEESRTLDLNLGKVALYQLSYSRVSCIFGNLSLKSMIINIKYYVAKTEILAHI
jgi:hypothetical protein